jgi:hypothetical protein
VNVVIVGQAPRSVEHPDDHEVWVINGPVAPLRWDRLFQLHGVDHIDTKHARDRVWPLISAAREPGRRLIMTRTYPGDPRLGHAEAYPLDEVQLECRGYLTNSFALCIALAVHERAERIVLDGLMIPQGTGQWDANESWIGPCIEYHLGRADALGIDVEAPTGCGLFRGSDFVYGFEGPGSI